MNRPRRPPPPRIGPFQVGRHIGGGGMASVHLARSVLAPEEIVALKIVKSELARELHYIDMFHDEAAILSRMDHPNIVRTLEFGVTGHHRYIAMELVLGRTLADVWDVAAARDERFAAELVAWIGARVASALHYAHTLRDESGTPLQIVHRDANPSNVVIAYDGDVKLIDFGLAKAAQRFAETGDGIVKGKVPYLAPEQILQDDVDARADVFTLGASLWEVLAMRRLFKRDNDLDTIRAIRDAAIPPLSTEAPDVPEALASIVMRCLRLAPAERFASAGELADALDGLYGRDDDVRRRELAAFVEKLFPGEREARASWRWQLRDE